MDNFYIVNWGYIGIMERKMEATIVNILGLYRDTGKDNGNYYRFGASSSGGSSSAGANANTNTLSAVSQFLYCYSKNPKP